MGVPLHGCMDEHAFKEQAVDLVIGVKASVKEYFEDTHPVSKATTFMNIGAWPWGDAVQLSQHRNEDVVDCQALCPGFRPPPPAHESVSCLKSAHAYCL